MSGLFDFYPLCACKTKHFFFFCAKKLPFLLSFHFYSLPLHGDVWLLHLNDMLMIS